MFSHEFNLSAEILNKFLILNFEQLQISQQIINQTVSRSNKKSVFTKSQPTRSQNSNRAPWRKQRAGENTNKEDTFFNQSECGQREKQIPPTNQEAGTEEAPCCTQKVPKETNTPTDQNVRAAEIHSSGRPRWREHARGPDRTKNHRPVLPVIIFTPAIFLIIFLTLLNSLGHQKTTQGSAVCNEMSSLFYLGQSLRKWSRV